MQNKADFGGWVAYPCQEENGGWAALRGDYRQKVLFKGKNNNALPDLLFKNMISEGVVHVFHFEIMFYWSLFP